MDPGGENQKHLERDRESEKAVGRDRRNTKPMEPDRDNEKPMEPDRKHEKSMELDSYAWGDVNNMELPEARKEETQYMAGKTFKVANRAEVFEKAGKPPINTTEVGGHRQFPRRG